jgi:hypothetical protein
MADFTYATHEALIFHAYSTSWSYPGTAVKQLEKAFTNRILLP